MLPLCAASRESEYQGVRLFARYLLRNDVFLVLIDMLDDQLQKERQVSMSLSILALAFLAGW